MIAKGGRPGGALYMVLLLLGVMVFISAMIPQVLVQASYGIRQDRGRDSMILALESATAFAEARLKRDLGDALLITDEPKVEPFAVKPTTENPDFGRKKPYDWESRLVRVKVHDVMAPEKSSVKTFVYAYRIWSKAWETKPGGRSQAAEINGLIAVRINVDKGKSGVPIRKLDGISFEAMNEDRAFLPVGSAPPTP